MNFFGMHLHITSSHKPCFANLTFNIFELQVNPFNVKLNVGVGDGAVVADVALVILPVVVNRADVKTEVALLSKHVSAKITLQLLHFFMYAFQVTLELSRF